jgi:deoxycytidine triphosphate deaminase
MSIKSDKWIRRMAQEHGMIEPFEPGQVRYAADGHKIVSYGTSSYGYDIRCAREFKIFTNVHSTVVDPKNLHHPAEQLRAGAYRRVLPHPAQRADDLPGQEHLRALRHHRQRDALRT